MNPVELLRCSARGCMRPATAQLRWNNAKIHPQERRKTWLACGAHIESLSAYLAARGLLREIEPLEGDGGVDPAPPPPD